LRKRLPSEVEQISDVTGVGQIFYVGRVEEDGEVGEFLERTVFVGVVGVVDEFDLLDVLVFGLVEVGVGGVDDDAQGAGLGH
jgi:hypothetical protein